MSTSAAIDVAAIKADFPILGRSVHGAPLVYLDSAATSQKPTAVLDAVEAYYRETNANVHRGVYELAAEATARYEGGRDAVARLVGAPREGVILTKNASEAINLVAWAWGVRNLRAGDRVLVTEMEHHSNIVPWQIVAGITGAEVVFAPVTPGGELDMDSLRESIGERTRLVAVTHCSNVLGTINPVAEIAKLAHDIGALCLVDGSQAVPHMPVDVPALGADFYAFTGHKIRQFPVHVGCASLGICRWNEDVARTTIRFMQAIGYQGILDIGYRYDPRDGQYKVLDANPRVGQAFRLFVAENDMDVVKSLYLDLTGQEQFAIVPREGRRWLIEDFDLISSLHYYQEGTLNFRDWVRSFKGVQEAAWFSWSDPRPFVKMVGDLLKRLAGWLLKRAGVVGETGNSPAPGQGSGKPVPTPGR